MKAVFHVYLYKYEDGFGFKIQRRDIKFYGVTPEDLNGKPFEIRRMGDPVPIEATDLVFAKSGNNTYGSFKSKQCMAGDLVRVDVDVNDGILRDLVVTVDE